MKDRMEAYCRKYMGLVEKNEDKENKSCDKQTVEDISPAE